MSINIAGRSVGAGRPTYVIAEIGVNHDGSLSRAVDLVHLARDCGADAIKLQIFQAGTLLHAASGFADYQKSRVDDADPRAMLRRYELSPDDVRHVVDEATTCGLVSIATPFSPADVDVIEHLNLPAVKIASPDLVNRPLLSRVLRGGRPALLSTGAATMQEVRDAASWMMAQSASFALLHCVSAYPTPTEHANLGWISELVREFDVPVGYSDHTTEVSAGAVAVGFGACVVEKHLTYDRAARGPDHSASADPKQFAEYVRLIRTAYTMRGTTPKHVLDIEVDVRTVSRQSLVLLRDVRVGAVLTHRDLTVQRPGTGISAVDVERVVGMRVARSMSAGTMLSWSDLAEVATHAA